MEDANLRMQKMSLLIGQFLGQTSELLNNIKMMTNDMIYKSLFDITKAASLTAHEIYYKEKK